MKSISDQNLQQVTQACLRLDKWKARAHSLRLDLKIAEGQILKAEAELRRLIGDETEMLEARETYTEADEVVFDDSYQPSAFEHH